MALYPEVQKKAQAEIDAVIGPNRLPDFHDRPSLPYINAVVKESSRWNLASPLGRPFFIIIITTILTSSTAIPHMSSFDDEYNGFYIPKGTIVIGNAWLVRSVNPISVLNFSFRSILNDRNVFDNPREFQPERYLKDGKLNPDMRDPDCAAFGFGRRSVNTTYSSYSLINSSAVSVLEDTSATTRYTQLRPVFSRYMTSNHRLTTREIPSSLNLSSPLDY